MNIPEVKLGIIAVSRDCFPIALSTQRRKNIVAAYGDKIVEWAKKIMGSCCCSKPVADPPAPEATAEDFAPAEEPVKEEAPAEAQEPAEDPVVEPILSDDAIPVADEEDFEG